jgi:AcrR family transcriptional regulator
MMTRQSILTAAAQIFSQKGYHATSMNDIAEAVNLQKASLYYHVHSKQEILLLLLDEALDLVSSRLNFVLAQPIPTEEKLRLAMQVYLSTLTEQRDLAAVLLQEHRSLAPEMRSKHLPRRDRFEQLWRDLLQMGVEQGAFQIEDIHMTARALLGMLNYVVTWYRDDGALRIDEISSQYTDLVLNGIMLRQG